MELILKWLSSSSRSTSSTWSFRHRAVKACERPATVGKLKAYSYISSNWFLVRKNETCRSTSSVTNSLLSSIRRTRPKPCLTSTVCSFVRRIATRLSPRDASETATTTPVTHCMFVFIISKLLSTSTSTCCPTAKAPNSSSILSVTMPLQVSRFGLHLVRRSVASVTALSSAAGRRARYPSMVFVTPPPHLSRASLFPLSTEPLPLRRRTLCCGATSGEALAKRYVSPRWNRRRSRAMCCTPQRTLDNDPSANLKSRPSRPLPPESPCLVRETPALPGATWARTWMAGEGERREPSSSTLL
mmetsp:Transcript_56824/g.144036  ORF Transcript_56824/g.144036 Transcript_56824/m.144036 type:complete len:301 (-) Transcript_56824:118-1020(-)